MAQCDFCFRDKSPLQPILPRLSVQVCKSCLYQIDRVIGFLRHSGASIVTQSVLETPLTPHESKATKSRSKPPKFGDKDIIPEKV